MKGAMSNLSGLARSHEQWARFRFSVIGPLLAAPPDRGELQEQLESFAAKNGIIPSPGNEFNLISRLLSGGFIQPVTRRKILCRHCAAKFVLTRAGTPL